MEIGEGAAYIRFMDDFGTTPPDGSRNHLLEVEHRLADLEDRFERLQLICQAQWELLRERSQISEGELVSKIDEIDRRDGEADEKLGHHPITCRNCGRVTTSRRRSCVYCGEPVERPHVFES